ncbi:apovitellenin-1-like [Hyperolius riggenbachi]|uniref:apovitellenin-1-like n=1 Tax=Hyperolius riggenbachi TaxID=752182 RepID=UPI0035A3698F
MRLVTVASAAFLFLLITNGCEGKAVSKRHVRRDWLIIPDTIAFNIFQGVNSASPEAGKALMGVFESEPVQKTMGFLIQTTSQITLAAEEYYKKFTDFLNEKKWFQNLTGSS